MCEAFHRQDGLVWGPSVSPPFCEIFNKNSHVSETKRFSGKVHVKGLMENVFIELF
jgi:hypothetical protein